MDAAPSAHALAELRAELMGWYRATARDLPWRRTRDPYAIWVSEVMLQQTRVETVRPYYERFLARWPTLVDLARADPDEVRSAWSGLGYYRRARALLDAAQIVADRHRGELPSEPEALAALPGFGPYTTGAVASIAFDHPLPAVDGNVARVLARIFAVEGDVSRGPGARAVRSRAEQLVPGEAPGELNQALIELGALVCGRRPDCGRCPVKRRCGARRLGLTDVIPPPRARAAPRAVSLAALVLADRERVLLQRRPEDGLFGGMWCPPVLDDHFEAPGEAASRAGWGPGPLVLRGDVTHLLTHRRIRARVYAGPLPRDPPPSARAVPIADLARLGLPSFAVKLLRVGIPPEVLPDQLPGRRRSAAGQTELPFASADGGPG